MIFIFHLLNFHQEIEIVMAVNSNVSGDKSNIYYCWLITISPTRLKRPSPPTFNKYETQGHLNKIKREWGCYESLEKVRGWRRWIYGFIWIHRVLWVGDFECCGLNEEDEGWLELWKIYRLWLWFWFWYLVEELNYETTIGGWKRD